MAEVAERAPASAPLLASPAVEGEMALYLKSPRKTADAPPVPKMQPRTVPVRLRIASAEQLPFSDASFDTVTDTFGLCSFDDPLRALREMARVCKPGGHVSHLVIWMHEMEKEGKRRRRIAGEEQVQSAGKEEDNGQCEKVVSMARFSSGLVLFHLARCMLKGPATSCRMCDGGACRNMRGVFAEETAAQVQLS